MPISIRVADANFTNRVSMVPPKWNDCAALFLFGGTEALSKRNLKTGADSTLIGNPTYAENYAGVGGDKGFQADITNTSNNWTHCVVTTVGVGNGIYMGNWLVGDTDNAVGRFNTLIYPYLNGSTRGTGTSYATATGFNFLATSHNGSFSKVYAANAGAISTVSAAYGPVTITAPLRIGGAIGTSATTNNVAAAMSFNAVLTDAEVLSVHNYLKFMCGQRGIAVA